MHILLTNDDGYDAPGLIALYRAVEQKHRISMVAPARERSACGHAATLSGGIVVRRVEHEVMGTVFAVEGTPVDCVRLAIAELVKDPIDCVISGINQGANVSIIDVASSGTIAAAREAAFCGLRAFAVSQLYRKASAFDWPLATRIVRGLLPQLLDPSAPRADVWSINLPAVSPGSRLKGVRVVPLSTDQVPLAFHSDGAPREIGEVFEYRGIYESRKISPETDIAALTDNHVAVTPIRMDPTEGSMLGFSLALDPGVVRPNM